MQSTQTTSSSTTRNRTNVRNRARALRWLKTGFEWLGPVAPSLAGRVAKAIFTRPGRYRPRPEEQAVLDRARRTTVLFRGLSLQAYQWGEGPQVYLMHGWSSSAGQLAAMVDPLLAAGYSVTAFDAPAHGGSGGTRTALPEIIDALDVVAERFGPAHGVIAHSMGSPVVAAVLARGAWRVARAVFVAPASSMVAATERFAAMLSVPDPARAAMQSSIEEQYAIAMRSMDLGEAPLQIDVPLLVVHDRGDRDVPYAEGEAVVRGWPRAVMRATEGLGHVRIVRDPSVVTDAVAFLGRPVPTDDWVRYAVGESSVR